ncbi:MAG: PPOX class F420-dependent oxidoreductase [Chloroflexota bacterium]|nr:PPOX class F420-dependent oxidoreductase [Chloroflexota bacterium]
MADEMRRFLEEPRFAVLATLNADGSPQQTVMWFCLDGGEIVMNTKRGRKKDRNMERDPRISVCVEDGDRYLTLTGALTIDEDPARGQDGIRRLAERYVGPEQAAEQVASLYSRQKRVTLRMRIESVDAHGFGGED